MNKPNVIIRSATLEDAEELVSIYKPYVEGTAITFEYDAPDSKEFRSRIQHILEKYPYLVAETDGHILGYAYASTFKDRAAYDRCVELSIYIDARSKGEGIGGLLYRELEDRLQTQGITNLYACIAYPQEEDEYLTADSVHFHEHLGYQMVGKFHRCGYKFNRWYHMVWMEKLLVCK